MFDFHDPVVQFAINVFVALISAISAVIVTLWVYQKQRTKKEISYEIVSNAPVVSVNKKMANRVKILLDGIEMANPSIVVIRIVNSGNKAIAKDDIIDQLIIELEGAEEVIFSEVLSTKPENYFANSAEETPFLMWGNSTILVDPKFSNPQTEIVISALIDGEIEDIVIRGTIADGNIKKLKGTQTGSSFKSALYEVLLAAAR